MKFEHIPKPTKNELTAAEEALLARVQEQVPEVEVVKTDIPTIAHDENNHVVQTEEEQQAFFEKGKNPHNLGGKM